MKEQQMAAAGSVPSFTECGNNTSAYDAFAPGHLANDDDHHNHPRRNFPGNMDQTGGVYMKELTGFAMMITALNGAGDYPRALAIGIST